MIKISNWFINVACPRTMKNELLEKDSFIRLKKKKLMIIIVNILRGFAIAK